MCDYQRVTWECRGDGYLWDADHDGYDPEAFDDPCPQCNTDTFLQRAREEAESVSSGSSMGVSYTGVSLWIDAVEHASEHNPEAAHRSLVRLAVVRALVDDPRHEDGYREETFVYV